MIAALKWLLEAIFFLIGLGVYVFLLFCLAVFVVVAIQKIKKEVQKHGRDN